MLLKSLRNDNVSKNSQTVFHLVINRNKEWTKTYVIGYFSKIAWKNVDVKCIGWDISRVIICRREMGNVKILIDRRK